jgi:hypothetical protein
MSVKDLAHFSPAYLRVKGGLALTSVYFLQFIFCLQAMMSGNKKLSILLIWSFSESLRFLSLCKRN